MEHVPATENPLVGETEPPAVPSSPFSRAAAGKPAERATASGASRPMPTPPPLVAPTEVLMGAPLEVPAFQPFSFQSTQALTPQELQAITTFHELYMQPPGIGQDRGKFMQARRDAAVVKPLMERQLTLARQGPEGAQGGEARTVEVNLAWVTQLLEMPG